jgi:archaeal flagellin FlaB
MLRKLINKIYGQKKGITGLETAIILIAFVVVAAVFAYTVLSAGLFSTQKSQEAVYAGLQQAQSTVELKGAVLAKAGATGIQGVGTVAQLTFTIALAAGGESMDFTNPSGGASGVATGTDHVVTISYIDKYQRVDNLYWSSAAIGVDNGNKLLEQGEKYQITVGGAAGGGNSLVDALTHDLTANDTFTFEVKSAKGAVLTISRTMPAYIDSVMTLN